MCPEQLQMTGQQPSPNRTDHVSYPSLIIEVRTVFSFDVSGVKRAFLRSTGGTSEVWNMPARIVLHRLLLFSWGNLEGCGTRTARKRNKWNRLGGWTSIHPPSWHKLCTLHAEKTMLACSGIRASQRMKKPPDLRANLDWKQGLEAWIFLGFASISLLPYLAPGSCPGQ